MVESSPQRKTIINTDEVSVKVEKSTDYPAELDPYNNVPVESEELMPNIEQLKAVFLRNRPEGLGWADFIPAPEGSVAVVDGEDDTGRKSLVVEISFPEPKLNNNEILRNNTERYFLYPNNIGIYKSITRSIKEVKARKRITGYAVEETAISQGFVDELHLQSLLYAGKIFIGGTK